LTWSPLPRAKRKAGEVRGQMKINTVKPVVALGSVLKGN
jgi:hypothetical protein